MSGSAPSLPAPRGIIIGHASMDLDCLGSLVLARYLHPGCAALRPGRLHPLAKNLYRIYETHLGLLGAAEVDLSAVEEVVAVDTRSFEQVREVFDAMPGFAGSLTVYDHHGEGASLADDGGRLSGLAGVRTLRREYGANVSLLAEILRGKGWAVAYEDATIALAGLFADTGNFCHANVKPQDFEAAAWLLGMGASLPLAKKFVSATLDGDLNQIMHGLLAGIQGWELGGHQLRLAAMDLDRQSSGLAVVVERIFELERADALFCVFRLVQEGSHLVIARSGVSAIDVSQILAKLGGGGHPASASALLRNSADIPVVENLRLLLSQGVRPAATAAGLMSRPAHCLSDGMSLLEAALFLERHNHGGAPVVDAAGNFCGMLGLREIQKGRKAGAMAAPVRAYMLRNAHSLAPEACLREIEAVFFGSEAGRVPVVSGAQVCGVISRSDLLAGLKGLRGAEGAARG